MKKIMMIVLVSLPLLAGELVLKSGYVAGHTQVMGDSTINPVSSHITTKLVVEGSVETLRGTVSVDATTFKSDNASRDENMHETIDSLKFGSITYTIDKVTAGESDKYRFEGMLNFHGVIKPVTLDADVTKNNDLYDLRVHGEIKLSDFGVDAPCLAFVLCVRDELEIVGGLNLMETNE
jgi:polyisoprenoid-binding protein YceI